MWKNKPLIEEYYGMKLELICESLAKGFTRYAGIIFSHDFAEAFWGENQYTYYLTAYPKNKVITKEQYEKEDARFVGRTLKSDGWQHHLQQMVLYKEPLKYIERFLIPKD